MNDYIENDARIYVAGHTGMVGSAITRCLENRGYTNILTRTRRQLDLLDQKAVEEFLAEHRPDYIFLAAAKVGGIQANHMLPAEFIYQNLTIQSNIIHGGWQAGVRRMLFLGSSCIYPREAPQPMNEECLLTGLLEQTNEAYAISKIAGIKLCESYNRQYGTEFLSVMPTNLYGPNDNYNLDTCHVLPALIRKVHEARERGAKELVVWGTGNPLREFLYVDDLADACVFFMESGIKNGLFNIGTGKDITIRALAELIMKVVGFDGKIIFDSSKPDGTPRKLLDVRQIEQQGWFAKTSLHQGIALAYSDFLTRYA